MKLFYSFTLVLFYFLLASLANAATPLDPNLANNNWQRVIGNATNRYICYSSYDCTSAPNPVSRTNPVGRSYGGDTFGGGKIWYFGGGHLSHPGNDLEIYDIASNTWTQQYTPEALPTSCISTPGNLANVTNPCRVNSGSGTTAITPSGKSYVEHMYQQQAWDASVGKYVMITFSGLWEWTIGTGWTRLSTTDPTLATTDSYAQVLTYSPPIGKLLTMGTEVNRGIYEFTRGVGWSASKATWPTASPNCSYQNSISEVYDPVRQLHFIACSDTGAWLTYNPVTHALVELTGVPAGAQGAQHLAFDTINNILLAVKVVGTSPSLYKYDQSGVWTAITPANGGPTGLINSSVPTLQFDATNQVFWFLNTKNIGGGGQGGNAEGDVELWAYRYLRQGTTRTVGVGKTYANPAAAATAIGTTNPFDRVEIDAGTYGPPGACAYWRSNNLTIVSVGGQAIMDAQQACSGGPAGGNAIWQVDGAAVTIDGVTLKNSQLGVQDRGLYVVGVGATLRNMTITNVDGIGLQVSGSGTGDIVVDNSQFYDNGDQAGCGGQEHNIYVGEVETFTLRYSYSRMANCGHLVKTRAHNNYILYNRITDENDAVDNSSNQLDVPQGGRTYIIGNIFRKSNCSDAGDTINFNEGFQGNGEPQNALQELYVINNTFDISGVTTGTCGGLSSARFIRIWGTNIRPLTVWVKNNIFDSHGAMTNTVVLNSTINGQVPTIVTSNNLCYGAATDRTTYCAGLTNNNPLFVNQAAFDYSLQSGSPAINAGANPGTGAGYALTPDKQYVHIASSTTRTQSGAAIDIGAFEGAGGGTPPPPTNVVNFKISQGLKLGAPFRVGLQ